MGPETRPTFDEIIGIFKAAKYPIVPRSDHVKLRLFVEDIEGWEADERVYSESRRTIDINH
jgi:hypothetical protein